MFLILLPFLVMLISLVLFVFITTSVCDTNSSSSINCQQNGYLSSACLSNRMSDLNRVLFTLTNQDQFIKISENKPRSSTCQRLPFKKYQMKDVVKCLDALSMKRNRRPMHIAFIGDSTVCQHFLSFLRLVPNNDWQINSRSSEFAEYYFHEDRNVTSRLFDNLLVSFYWRNLIRSDLISDFKRWASSDATAPDIILIGLTAHHIRFNDVTSNLKEYEQLFERVLLPLMEKSLSIHPHQEIIWLHQSPTNPYLSLFLPNKLAEMSSHTMIPHYNLSIRRILMDSKVKIWDSTNIVVTEYLRACALTRVQRKDSTRYFNCEDLIHPGFGALSIGTQLFVNHICSSVA